MRVQVPPPALEDGTAAVTSRTWSVIMFRGLVSLASGQAVELDVRDAHLVQTRPKHVVLAHLVEPECVQVPDDPGRFPVEDHTSIEYSGFGAMATAGGDPPDANHVLARNSPPRSQ